MAKFIDRTGQRFGQLLIVGRAEDRIDPNGSRKAVWSCLCDCGIYHNVRASDLSRVVSCGRHKAESARERFTKHGKRSVPEYSNWAAMRGRCHNSKNSFYATYGGAGVKVCERWNDFAKFYEDMGPRPTPKHSLDRYPDKNGNYEPGNVRWASPVEQANNRRPHRSRAECRRLRELRQ